MNVPVYALAYLRDVRFGEEIIEYLQKIDATLVPYGGRFVVHGGTIKPAEGTWDGDLVIIEFPDHSSAKHWYDSPAYQEILPLRTENSDSIACLVAGLPPGYQASDKLSALLSEATG